MNDNNGGYYAIKGFLYQFDKTLIEILKNPIKKIGIEKKQDIDIQDYVIQVKHKETQNYSPSKIKNAVIQLLNLFKGDKSQKFCLYCYFKDKSPVSSKLSLKELDAILGDKKDDYLSYLKNDFNDNFTLTFSTDFEKQFEELLELIKSSFSLSSIDNAIMYHSIFRSKLLDISIKDFDQREISKEELISFMKETEQRIFYKSYSKYLGREKYERLIKKEFFTFKSVNIDCFERLFLIDCHNNVSLVDVNKIVNCISNKYFKRNKSPQPFLCFLNLKENKLTELKRELIDQGIMFNDGTYFDGDKFRLDHLIEKEISNDLLKVKITSIDQLHKLLEKVKIREIFQFYLNLPIDIDTIQKHIKIEIEETNQIINMVC